MRSRVSIGCVIGLIAGLLGSVAASTSAAGEASLPGVSGLCGTAVIRPMPTSLDPDSAVNRAVQVFSEVETNAQGFAYNLTSPVPVDVAGVGVYDRPAALPSTQPVVAAGEPVASWLVHWDPPPDTAHVRRTVTIGFSGQVMGVQILPTTVASTASEQFHAPGVGYPGTVAGLQLAPNGMGDVLRVLDRYTVSISFTGFDTVTEFRIITVGLGAFTRFPGSLAPGPHGSGYSMLGADGGVFVFEGDSGYWGSLGGTRINQPVVSGARTCSGEGYWLAARDGGVFSFGDAVFHGSLGGAPLDAPVVAMSATPTGNGYYLVTATGQVSPFGDAHFYGDARALHLNKPIVGIAATLTGNGYWLVASDGGIFSYGDAAFDGSTGNLHLNSPIVGMRAAPNADGYYLFASDGGVFAFSSMRRFGVRIPLPFFGSAATIPHSRPIVGMRLAVDGGGGYWLNDSAGRAFGFGPSAPSGPGMSGTALAGPIIGML
jgi:hypothetical protein